MSRRLLNNFVVGPGAELLLAAAAAASIVGWGSVAAEWLTRPGGQTAADGLVATLFFLPIIVQILCAVRLRRDARVACFHFSGVMFIANVMTDFAWILLLLGPKQGFQVWAESVLTLFAAVTVVALALWYTHTMLSGADSELRMQIASHRFCAVCFFLAAFLCVSYLLAFTVAFADSATDGKSLYYGLTQQTGSPKQITQPLTTRLFFKRNQGYFDDLEQTGVARDWPRVLSEDRGDASPNSCDGKRKPQSLLGCNALALMDLSNWLATIDPSERVNVTIMAHADPNGSESEPQNWQLTQLRGLEVQRRLYGLLEEPNDAIGDTLDPAEPKTRLFQKVFMNIRWAIVPVASQKTSLNGAVSGIQMTPEAQRHVEVRAVRVPGHLSEALIRGRIGQPKSLLDYVYFMMYTITTTGYGDMMPSSPFVKFVVTLANIFEVVFLVVFFNALISSEPTKINPALIAEILSPEDGAHLTGVTPCPTPECHRFYVNGRVALGYSPFLAVARLNGTQAITIQPLVVAVKRDGSFRGPVYLGTVFEGAGEMFKIFVFATKTANRFREGDVLTVRPTDADIFVGEPVTVLRTG